MTWTDKLFRRWGFDRTKPRRFRPAVEPLEAREVPAVLQGYAFTDAGPAGFDPSDTPRAGATVTLLDQGGVFVGTRTTDATGYYRFENLNPGTYKLVESAAGLATTAAQTRTAFSGATVNADQSITVTVPGAVTVARQPGLAGVAAAYTLAGAPFNDFTSSPNTGNAHQFLLNLTSAANPTPQSVYSFCVDLFHPNPATFGTTVSDTPSVPGLATNLGRIGYLYSTFGSQLLSPTDGTGLQLAIYELLYDATPNLFSGNFQLRPGTDFGAMGSAQNFLDLSAGKDIGVTFLNVTTPTGTDGQQGMIAAEFYNFLNAPTSPPTAGLGDFVWRDNNSNGAQDAGEPGVNGVPVELLVNGQVVATTTTATNPATGQGGYYQFTGLTPGVAYQVCFTAPTGLAFTTPFQGGNPALDSNVNQITGAEGCTPTVTLAPGEFNPTIDAGLVATSPPPAPAINIVKTANQTQFELFQPVTYAYRVTNPGGGPLAGVTVADDNATPGYAPDDFRPTFTGGDGNGNGLLDPGEVWVYTATVIPPLPTFSQTSAGASTQVGMIVPVILPNGNLQVTYVQSQSVNDNRYGTGASAVNGWNRTHTFNDLVGSDKVEFVLKNAAGATVLDFYEDYISASTAFPSGYGSLGVTGGEGQLLSGNGAYVLSATTSLTENLRLPQFRSGFLVNSPAETGPNSGASAPGGWDYNNSYTVVIDKAAFGGNVATGLGSISVPFQHNSPAKMTLNTPPTPHGGSFTNIANATGTATGGGGQTVTASATATVQVGPGGGTTGPTKFFVVDRGKDTTYGYTATGGATTSARLGGGNGDPRGIASNAAGTTHWVIDHNKTVYVYDAAGTALGNWKPGGLDTPEDIATDGTNIWIVDAKKDQVFFYAGAAALRGGSANPTSSFNLAAGNQNALGLVTDGQSLWTVDDAATDKVFKYTTAGAPLGSWTIDPADSQPRGLTIDPNNVSDIWIVDGGRDAVFRYAGAATVTSGSRTATDQFALVAGATDPQGIADPPPVPVAVPGPGGDRVAALDRHAAPAADTLVVPAPAPVPAARLPVSVGERLATFDTCNTDDERLVRPTVVLPVEAIAPTAGGLNPVEGAQAGTELRGSQKAEDEWWGLGLAAR